MLAPIWKLPAADPLREQALAQSLGTSPLLARLLINRGFAEETAARAFLTPRLRDLEPPEAIMDMTRGAERLRRAIKNRERILIYGDYDVDGMTGTSLLVNFIRYAGGIADHYIPNRLREGYSFNDEAIDAVISAEDPYTLVVTVDHGTSARAGIERLAAAGIDVVVTDHHEPPEIEATAAYALINPRRRGCTSTFKDLCGAAVAFKLVWATAQAFSDAQKVQPEFRDFLVEATAYVALATVADVVPLVGENRILCSHGLVALTRAKSPGLCALLERTRLGGKPIHAVHLGFRLGPLLNAAGRMGIADVAIELLTSADRERASLLARTLEQANEERRRLERDMLKSCLELPELKDFDGKRGICLGRRGWHVGVIGIVASRLVDRFGVPALIAGLEGEKGRASARTSGGIHLKELLDDLREHLIAYGGHAGAAGATVSEAAFPAFKRAFEERSAALLAERNQQKEIAVDTELPFHAVTPGFLEELDRLAPYGAGNPPALFLTRNVQVCGSPQIMGKDRSHLSMTLREGDKSYRAVGFGLSAREAELRVSGRRYDFLHRLKFDNWSGAQSIELELKDFRPSEHP